MILCVVPGILQHMVYSVRFAGCVPVSSEDEGIPSDSSTT
jgi:hypothetical protein